MVIVAVAADRTLFVFLSDATNAVLLFLQIFLKIPFARYYRPFLGETCGSNSPQKHLPTALSSKCDQYL